MNNFNYTISDSLNVNDFVSDGYTNTNDGLQYDGDIDTSVLDNPNDKYVVVDPALIEALQNANQNTNSTIDIEHYLQAILNALNQLTNPQAVPESVPAEDNPTLAPVELTWPEELPVAWPVELPDSEDAPYDLPQDSTPVTDPSSPADPETSVPELTVDLKDYFPFCLPWDVYAILQKFNADPVTPTFTLSFPSTIIGASVPLQVDLSQFDSVAAVARKMESISYIVGLAVVTRQVFLRG